MVTIRSTMLSAGRLLRKSAFIPVVLLATMASLGLSPALQSPQKTNPDLIDGVFTAVEWAQITKLSPLPPVPPDPTNKYADDPRAAALGKKLYFEKHLSGTIQAGEHKGESQKVSCASCHGGPWGDHGHRVSIGTIVGGRNAIPIVNSQFYDWYFWAGRAATLWQANIGAGNSIMDAHRMRVAHVLYDFYKDEYNSVFRDYPLPPQLDRKHPEAARFPENANPGRVATSDKGEGQLAVRANADWDAMRPEDQAAVNRIAANAGKAEAAYMRLLVSRNAAFDRYVAGDHAAINESAKRGLQLFVGKARCLQCHTGPAFTDNKFHNTGLRQEGTLIRTEDYGRYEELPIAVTTLWNADSEFSDDRSTGKLHGAEVRPDYAGRFRTKALREIAETAPYMHTGSLKTLSDVMQFYNRGGDESGFPGTKSVLIVPLKLTDGEIADIVELLKTLTGERLSESLLPRNPDADTFKNWSD